MRYDRENHKVLGSLLRVTGTVEPNYTVLQYTINLFISIGSKKPENVMFTMD